MNPSEIAEHDRLYPLRRSDESADAFLRRCIMEHRLSHELYVEMLRKNPELATEATCGMAYQQRAVHRYDEMLAALAEIVERAIEESRGQEPIAKWCCDGKQATGDDLHNPNCRYHHHHYEPRNSPPMNPPKGNENV